MKKKNVVTDFQDDSDCLLRINSRLPNLSGKERITAQYVVENPSDLLKMTIYDLSDVINVSPASLTRFTKRMGYRGFNDFKIALAHSVGAREPDPISEEYKTGSPEAAIGRVFEENVRTLRNTIKIISPGNLIRAAKLCSAADRIHFYGVGSSGLIAQDAAMRLSVLGFKTGAYTDAYCQLASAVSLNDKDVAWAISHTGSSTTVVHSLRIAKESGARTICITNYTNSPLIKVADIPLLTSSLENRIHVAALTSHVAQLTIIDALYILIASEADEKSLGRLSRLEDCIIELLRED